MKNINNIIQNSLDNDNSFINLRINLDQIDDIISDQKISEIIELVKQSFPFTFIGRQKIRRVIDQLDFAFWIKDPHKKYVIVNRFFAESVGLNLNKIEGQHLADVLIESEAKLLSSLDDYIVNSSNSVVYETYSKTFSKELNQNIEFPICDLDKKVVAIIGFNQIIDDVKSAETKESKISKSIFENLPNILVEVDNDYLITNCTNKFIKEFDLNREDVLNKGIDTLLKIDLTNQYEKQKSIHKIGNTQYVLELSKISETDESSGYFIMFQKSEDDKSKVSKTMYDLIMNFTDQPMFIYNVENLKFLKANEAALSLYGYNEEEFLNMDLTDLYAPEDIQTLVETTSKDTIERGFSGPWRHKKKDGTSLSVEINKTQVDFEGVLSHFNVVKNISENLQSEKELQQYKIAFENTSDILIFTDLEGFITYSNSRVNETLQYASNTLVEKPFISLVTDKDRAKINTSIFHANEIKKITLDTELKISNGEYLPVEISSTPIYNSNDEVESFGLIIIPKAADVIENIPTQTPIKIVKESKSKINGEFLSSLFHELLTPINVIIGFAQELAESISDPDDEQKESIEIIVDNQRTVVELMDNAIQYAQLIQHQIDITPSTVKFVDVIDTIENDVSKISKYKNVSFAYGKISSSLKFITDKQKMITIISFLVEFAMKATKNPKVYLSAYQNDAGHCIVSVKDERTGISPELVTALDEIFNGDEEQVRQKYGISRFMLRHARKLSDLLTEKKEVINKFNIAVEYGYTFPIRFVDREEGIIISPSKNATLIDASSVPSLETEIVTPPKTEVKTDLENEEENLNKTESVIPVVDAQEIIAEDPTVDNSKKLFSNIACLYVEDQIDSQILFKVQMKDLKNIEFATSFEKAIPLLKSMQFDLIVMDINLQGEYNGLDAMRAIKRMPGYADTPIIAVTAYILPGDRERFIKAGFNDFISKPVLRDKLEIVVDKLF